MKSLTYIYFSATSTTAKCVETVGAAMNLPVVNNINLADDPTLKNPEFSSNDVVIFAAPVYGGRLPGIVTEALRGIKGKEATAVAMVVYGNRDYDDALLELTDIIGKAGFNILGAGAFISQHSIFPQVATGRPDEADLIKLTEFGQRCRKRLDKGLPYYKIIVKGNLPYKKSSGVPIHPQCDKSKCNRCGVCADKCPTRAITIDNPTETDAAKCISCGRCIYICPRKVRSYSGFKYGLIKKVFVAGFSKRKEPSWLIAN
ncbi:MAG: 4Fe-4S binding protein [Bacteroides sp.]|nr:4Fe-4S binding protein [Bacteroides sp.]